MCANKKHNPIYETASISSSAILNGKIQLPCDVSTNADDSVALVLWYKDDSLSPIYTIDARKGKYQTETSALTIYYHILLCFLHSIPLTLLL